MNTCASCGQLIGPGWASTEEYRESGYCIVCLFGPPPAGGPALKAVDPPKPPELCRHTTTGGLGYDWMCDRPPHKNNQHHMVRKYPYRPAASASV